MLVSPTHKCIFREEEADTKCLSQLDGKTTTFLYLHKTAEDLRLRSRCLIRRRRRGPRAAPGLQYVLWAHKWIAGCSRPGSGRNIVNFAIISYHLNNSCEM